MNYLALVGVAILLATAIGRRLDGSTVAFLALLGALVLYPKSFSRDPNPLHVGIAESVPAVTTYIFVLLCVGYALFLRLLYRPVARSVPISVWFFFGFLLVGFCTIWHGTEEQLAGALQLGFGFLAWSVGGQLGPLVLSDVRRTRWTANAVAVLVGVETVVSVLQRAGVRINPMTRALAAIMGDRTNGTTNHPDNLGKVLLLLLILALGLMGTTDARARRTLWIAVALMFIPLGLSEGRANMLAALTTVMFWALLSGRRRALSIRLGIPALVVLIALFFAGSLAKRIEEDPHGGARSDLAVVAKEQIQRAPWGVGPNSYVSVVSSYSHTVALGYPVHNAYLLTAAELGVMGAILFWLPVAELLILATKSRRSRGFRESFAIAILASTPGMYAVTSTGWALLSNQLLPLWFLVLGVSYSQIRSSSRLRLREAEPISQSRSSAMSPASDPLVPSGLPQTLIAPNA